MATSSFSEKLELRRSKFWQQCTECAAHHNARLGRGVEWEWPMDGVEDFFQYWSATNKKGLMRWETLTFKSIGQRMSSYMKRRRYLHAFYNAKLENARNPRQRGKSLEQRRAEAQDEEAQSVYDRFFEEQEGKKIED